MRTTAGRKTRAGLAGGFAGVLMLGIGTSLFAHEDDPKAKSLIPRYEGPGWRRAVDGVLTSGGFTSEGVTLGSWLTLGEFAGNHGNANDIWGYVSPTGREYALLGMECGTGVVEVTDPDNAVIVGTILGACSLWGDIKVFGNYAYKVTESSSIGIQVIDLFAIDLGIVVAVNEIDNGDGKTHNVVIDTTSGFLYRVGGRFNGMGIYDLNVDPVDPPLVGSWSDRYIHDAQVVTVSQGKGVDRQLMFAFSGDNGGWENGRLEILDVTDKGNIFTVSEAFYSNTVYSHQGWLSPDHTRLYLDDELDEASFGTETTTRIFDVSDIDNPSEIGTFTNGLFTIDHNLFVDGDLIFQANYTSGLRVFDASDPDNPVEIAFFDTRPEDDVTDFFGLWGNYPFLPSGTVLGSDEQRGLFVWTVDARKNQCPNDLDGSGVVDFGDILVVLAAWGQAGGDADLDGSGFVDFGDILIILEDWGTVCP